MAEGYVKLWRSSFDSQVWQDASLWQVWCWCLMRASYRDQWVPMKVGRGMTVVKVGPGQFLFGRKEAAKQLKMKQSSVRNRMEKLQNMRNLDIKPDRHFSVITILNWVRYQVECDEDGQPIGQPEDSQRTAEGQPKDTYKKVKKGKKVEKVKKEEGAAVADSLPAELNTEAFTVKWYEWVNYRKEIRKALRPSTIKAQWKKLAKIGAASAIACIDESISNGWTGLFPEKYDGQGQAGPGSGKQREKGGSFGGDTAGRGATYETGQELDALEDS